MASDVEKLARELLAAAVGDQMTAEDFIRNDGAICFVDEALAAVRAALTHPAASGGVVGFTYEACGAVHIQWTNDPSGQDCGLPAGVNLYATPQPDADTVRKLVEALEEIVSLEGTESDEWDGVERLIPEMVAIARAAIDSAIKGEK